MHYSSGFIDLESYVNTVFFKLLDLESYVSALFFRFIKLLSYVNAVSFRLNERKETLICNSYLIFSRSKINWSHACYIKRKWIIATAVTSLATEKEEFIITNFNNFLLLTFKGTSCFNIVNKIREFPYISYVYITTPVLLLFWIKLICIVEPL